MTLQGKTTQRVHNEYHSKQGSHRFLRNHFKAFSRPFKACFHRLQDNQQSYHLLCMEPYNTKLNVQHCDDRTLQCIAM